MPRRRIWKRDPRKNRIVNVSGVVAVHAILTQREENLGISNIEQGVQKEERTSQAM